MLTEWADDKKALEHGLSISKYAGCPLEPYEDLLNCLRNANVSTLLQAFRTYNVSECLYFDKNYKQ